MTFVLKNFFWRIMDDHSKREEMEIFNLLIIRNAFLFDVVF